MFLWRLARVSLPSEDVWKHCNMCVSFACSLCGAEDSWKHSNLECSMSQCVWVLVDGDLLQQMMATNEPNPYSWLFSMFESVSHEQLVHLVVTLWAIWMARRKVIHDSIFQTPFAMHEFVNR